MRTSSLKSNRFKPWWIGFHELFDLTTFSTEDDDDGGDQRTHEAETNRIAAANVTDDSSMGSPSAVSPLTPATLRTQSANDRHGGSGWVDLKDELDNESRKRKHDDYDQQQQQHQQTSSPHQRRRLHYADDDNGNGDYHDSNVFDTLDTSNRNVVQESNISGNCQTDDRNGDQHNHGHSDIL